MGIEYQWVSALSPEEIRYGMQEIIREKDKERYSLLFGKWVLQTKELPEKGSLYFQLYYQAFTIIMQYSPLLRGEILPQGRGSVVRATTGLAAVNMRTIISLLMFIAASLYLQFVAKIETLILFFALFLLLCFVLSYLYAQRERPYLAIMDRAAQAWHTENGAQNNP